MVITAKYCQWYNPPRKKRILSSLLSKLVINHNIHSSTRKMRKRLELNQNELNKGCMMGIDSWADTCCLGKHAYVREFIEGKTVSASGFTSTLPSVDNIPLAHCRG